MMMVDVGSIQKVLLFCKALTWTATWEGACKETRVAGGLHEGGTVNTSHEVSGVSDPGWGSPPGKILNATENYCPPCPTSIKILHLHS
jgi:hypothetical protein